MTAGRAREASTGGATLRAVLTAVAIVLGVALVAGTFVLTDSITGAFNSIFQTIYSGTDATVTGRNAIDSSANGGRRRQRRLACRRSRSRCWPAVQALPDVKDAIGDVSGSLQLVSQRQGDHLRRRPQSRLQRRSRQSPSSAR